MTSPQACAETAFTSPLFEPIAPILRDCNAQGALDVFRLNALLERLAPGTCSSSGAPIRFVAPAPEATDYEAHIHATGEVPTRSDNWHDAFNALAWCVWPTAKTACNAAHLDAIRARKAEGLPGRGPRRDALTQFDECGVVVASSEPDLLAHLAAHEWEAAFWSHRARLLETTRFHVFGHGTWDQLRAPFFGLCAKALYRHVDAGWAAQPVAARQADCDRWLATHLDARLRTPRDLAPLPVMGIPGVTPDNEAAAYYRDTRQFRPKRG